MFICYLKENLQVISIFRFNIKDLQLIWEGKIFKIKVNSSNSIQTSHTKQINQEISLEINLEINKHGGNLHKVTSHPKEIKVDGVSHNLRSKMALGL